MLLCGYNQRGLCTKSPCTLISRCNLCVLCVSVVCFCPEFINHRDTENTEKRAFVTFCAKPSERYKFEGGSTCLFGAIWKIDTLQNDHESCSRSTAAGFVACLRYKSLYEWKKCSRRKAGKVKTFASAIISITSGEQQPGHHWPRGGWH